MQHISQNTNKPEFEYRKLPVRQRAQIRQLTLEIKKSIRNTVQTSWEIGKKLAEARRQLDPLEFSSWLEVEFDWSRRTAYNFIYIYEAFPEFASANFARLDISISALYLLAAPSTQPEIRHDFLNKALAGERITHKVIQTAIRSVKVRVDNNRVMAISPDLDDSRSNAYIEPQPSEIENSIASTNSDPTTLQPPVTKDAATIASDLHPAWNKIDPEFSLFWGDTSSPRFSERLPENAFVLAVPYCQWHHNWLVNESRNCIVIERSQLKRELLEGLLSVLSLNENALIFPWLPNWKTIELALNLNLKVYAGDPDLQQCQRTIANLGLDKSKIERIRW